MKQKIIQCLCLAGLVAAFLVPSPAYSDSRQGGGVELGKAEAKSLRRQARKALEGGRFGAAVGYYEQILDAFTERGEIRSEALYAVAMARLSAEPTRRDLFRARALLAELILNYPEHPRRMEITVARSWLAERDELESQLTVQEREVNRQKAAVEAALREIDEQDCTVQENPENTALEEEVRSLRRQLSRTQVDLASTRSELKSRLAELEKKEEALKKLKDALLLGEAGS